MKVKVQIGIIHVVAESENAEVQAVAERLLNGSIEQLEAAMGRVLLEEIQKRLPGVDLTLTACVEPEE